MKLCPQCRSYYPDDYHSCPRDQTQLTDATAEITPGTILRGKYEVLSELGVGGMATVYKVRHRAFQEIAAVKVVHSQFMHDPAFIKRFRNEAIVARQLKHPNAVRIDDFDYTDDGRPFIVMEFVDGRSLYQLRKDAPGPWPTDRCLDIVSQAAQALGAAHTLGIVHRDIKPANIILLRGQDDHIVVKVLDFGIAKVGAAEAFAGMTSVQTQQSLVIGTPEYMSPEQAGGLLETSIDGRSDLYSLGLVLYEMLTGAHPFQADTAMGMLIQQVNTTPAPPDSVGHVVSPAISALVLKSLQKNPHDRFRSAAELLAALQNPEAWYESELRAPVTGSRPPAAAPTVFESSLSTAYPPRPEAPNNQASPFQVVSSQPAPTQAVPSQPVPGQPVPRPAMAFKTVPPSMQPGAAKSGAAKSGSSRGTFVTVGVIAAVLLLTGVLWAGYVFLSRSHPKPTPVNETSAATSIPAPGTSLPAATQPVTTEPSSSVKPAPKGETPAITSAKPSSETPIDTGKLVARKPKPDAIPVESAEESGRQAAALVSQKRYAEAVPLARRACDGGYTIACASLGNMYQNGNGVEKNAAQAAALYRKSCDGGNSVSCPSLGYMYESGTGVAKDDTQATILYRKACDGGDALGCSYLGNMYRRGSGVAQDYTQAVAFFQKGCNRGSAQGCTNLGAMYQAGTGVAQNTAQAVALFRKACDGGNAQGCTNLKNLAP